MTRFTRSAALAILSPLVLAVQCGEQSAEQAAAPEAKAAQAAPAAKPVEPSENHPFAVTSLGAYDEPWALAFAPGTNTLFITEKPGTIRFIDTLTRQTGTVTGALAVAYGGQGGLGDIAFLASEASPTLGGRTIYLSWAEPGAGELRGAAAGRGQLVCDSASECRIENLAVIWRQSYKVNGTGHYSHRFAFSPDGQYLFMSSGDRQNYAEAQDLSHNMGKVVRLNLDGTPAAGNPFDGQAGKAQDIWSWGHRNPLGLAFDLRGNLWDLEHGPNGGDELNFVRRAKNYGWPVVSEGEHYDGRDIPPHSTRPGFGAPAVAWTPVIAPGGMIFYRGRMFPAWRGQALIAGMKRSQLIRVAVDGRSATEVARHQFERRLRDVEEGPDGAVWLIEDRAGGRLLRLTPP